MIYNFLFFKAYKQVIKSRNFDEFPVFGASIYVTLVLILNLLSLLCILERNKIVSLNDLLHSYLRYIIPITILFLVWLYYTLITRRTNIIERLNKKQNWLYNLPGWLVFFIYYFTSGFILLLTAMYKNNDWIFG